MLTKRRSYSIDGTSAIEGNVEERWLVIKRSKAMLIDM